LNGWRRRRSKKTRCVKSFEYTGKLVLDGAVTNIRIDAAKSFWGAGRCLSVPHLVLDISYEKSFAGRKPFRKYTLALMERLFPEPQALVKDLISGSPGSILGLLAISMQRYAGHDVNHFSAQQTGSGNARVSIEHLWPAVAEAACQISVHLTDLIFGDIAWSAGELRFHLDRYLEICAKGPQVDMRYLHGEAKKAGIPVTFAGPNSLLLGQGFRRRRMQGKTTDRTSQLACQKASDKTRTIEALKQLGLPTPQHVEVQDADQAAAAASMIGFPVVVKPVTLSQGAGITVGAMTEDEVRNAYIVARKFDPRVAVESFVPGETFRLLVVDGKFTAASRTRATALTGDGRQTIRDLVNRINSAPERGPEHLKPLTWLALDREASTLLQSVNLTPDSVLKAGQTVYLRTASNLSRGGESVAVTEETHEEVRRLAELCALEIGLDIAGVDYRAATIDRPWQEAGGAVIEINQGPGLRMHIAPAVGEPVDAGRAILGMLYPEGTKSRIPIAAVTGTNGKTTTTRMIAHILSHCGMITARTTTDEMAVGDHIILKDDCAGAGFARQVLAMPHVEAAALEVARGGVIKYGLGFERCDVAVVTNIEADHIGELGVESQDELADVKKIVSDSADGAVVLNGDDPRCLKMAPSDKNRSVVLFSMKDNNPEVLSHIVNGGAAFFLKRKGEEQWICRAEGNGLAEIINVDELPITHKGMARHNIQNAMAAIAAAEQLGPALADITTAVRGFESNPSFNYGRLSFIDGFPFTVIVDYAHNKNGYEALCAFLRSLDIPGRKICTFGLNGTRVSDATALDTVEALAPHFDIFAPCDWANPKLRRAGLREVMRQGLLNAGVNRDTISTFDTEGEGIQFSLRTASEGDLVVILGGVKDHVLKTQLELYRSGLSA
jgi:cyanophycin synthetase